MTLYFDTNVFDRLLEGSPSDLRRLASWKASGGPVIVLSVLNLEEVMQAEPRDPEKFRRLMRTILHWFNGEMVVKPIDQLLSENVMSYADGQGAVQPILSGEQLTTIQKGMNQFLLDRSDPGVLERLTAILETYAQNRSYKEAIEAVSPELRMAAREDRHRRAARSFEAFFRDSSTKFAETFARKCGVFERCAARGVGRMVQEIGSVRALSGILCSTVYSHAVEGREVQTSDSRDLQHFTLASSVADVFVTKERSLSYRVRRIPVPSVTIWDGDGLLANCPI